MRDLLRTSCVGVTLCAAALLGCDDRDARTEGETPTLGERVDRGLDKAGDAIDHAADRTGDVVAPAVDDAVQRTRQAGEAIQAGARDLAADVAGGVHDLLGDVTEDAMTRGELDDLVESFSRDDRNRIGHIKEGAHPQLDAELDKFNQAWKAKYGREFDIEDDSEVFSFVTVKGDENDSNRATVVFPARGGMPELSVPVVRERNEWRLDVPDALTADQLVQNLISGLKPINAGDPPLPDDEMEAYRRTAHGTMAALLGERRAP